MGLRNLGSFRNWYASTRERHELTSFDFGAQTDAKNRSPHVLLEAVTVNPADVDAVKAVLFEVNPWGGEVSQDPEILPGYVVAAWLGKDRQPRVAQFAL